MNFLTWEKNFPRDSSHIRGVLENGGANGQENKRKNLPQSFFVSFRALILFYVCDFCFMICQSGNQTGTMSDPTFFFIILGVLNKFRERKLADFIQPHA